MRFRVGIWVAALLCGWWGLAGYAAAQTASCVKPNVLILLNKSSNMNATKWNQARLALGQLVQARNQNTRFGLALFDTNASVRVTIRDNALTAMVPVVVQSQPGGQANHKRAIAAVRTYLLQELGRDREPTRSYSVVLVTDGTSTDGDPSTDITALRTLTAANGTRKNVQIFVLGVLPGGTINLLRWARAGGTARPYLTNQVGQLSGVLQRNEPQPRPEQCDGQDNDCDGQTDENLQRGCLGNCPGGTTATGTQQCQNGQWTTCQVQRRPEACNGRDDDCNGRVDDNLQPLACQTRCGTGTLTCSNGRWINCTAPLPSPEVCDGKDNDCDGEIDERCACKDGDSRPCGTNTGECSPGTQVCQGGQWSTQCVGEQGPRGEQCDNKDNDCDGLVDENLRRLCTNACGRGVETCTAGSWGGCTAPTPKTETCNGQDDDCDGIIDEGCRCQVGQTRPCGTDTGVCRRGTNICISGQWSTNCFNSVGPSTEVCDRQDNDCDGLTDENITRPCRNSCGTGTERCVFGRWAGCTAPNPQTEVCDGKDNDCDGQIDEGIQRACYDGPANTQDVGECKGGTQTCSAGKWGACANQVIPTKESCDGKDNDCNGQIDDNCPCRPGQTQPCGSNVGACKQGTQSCVAGKWGACTGDTKPTKEDCNGADDDCDGQTDEQLTRSCTNACGSGVESCLAGRWRNCTAPTPRREICGNNRDDNCDGQIDENCPCRPGQTRPCGSSVGVCKPGTQTCVNGTWSDSCIGGVTGSKEICDNLDNDCNGRVDDGITCACQNGAVRPCYSGPPNTAGKGICKPGSQRCVNNQWTQCAGEVLPKPETCDNIDNNCDGNRDEKISRACQTPCGVGTQTCNAGSFGPCSAPAPKPEICGNNIDDNCNGQTDETCPCKTGQTRPCGGTDVGECKRGIETCVANKWSGVCVGEVKPTKETCDGKDNDCNGQVDDKISCLCREGATQACYSGPAQTRDTGACKSGVQTCRNGQWGRCLGEVLPSPERCDGIDNNCNALTDEGLARACNTPCGTGRQLCIRGSYGPCSTPPPTPEVCDGRDNDCDGQTDEGAPCPPNSACVNGACVTQDAGIVDVQPPQCTTNADCPSGFICRGGQCVESGPDTQPECRTDRDCPAGFVCRQQRCVENVVPDTQPDTSPDASPDVVPDITPSPSCTVNADCGPASVCRWARCHKACTTSTDCSSGVCLVGLCVPQCVADVHCPSGLVCRAGLCRDGCRKEIDCTGDRACVGFACAPACTSDADCLGGHCLDGKNCVPRCNLAADCPPGFACNAGKCVQACSSFDQSRSCSESQRCSAGQCKDDCGQQSCPGSGTFECKGNVCVQKCASDSECQANEACLSGTCVPRCSIQDDCPRGSRCHEGLCFPSCRVAQDCPQGRSCLGGRCVAACSTTPTPVPPSPAPGPGPSPSPAPEPPPPPTDGGAPDAPPAPDAAPDTTSPDNSAPNACVSSAQACAGGTCHITCTNAASCKTGYLCGKVSEGATGTVCLPPCRVDVDCPSTFSCRRGVCQLGCRCASGEACKEGRCVRSCQADGDCPQPQFCKEGICKDPDPLEKDRGDIGKTGIPKLKLSGGCGCRVNHKDPSSWLMFLLLSLLIVPITRRKRA